MRTVAAALALALVVAVSATSAAAQPSYAMRLAMPSELDELGHSRSVTADLATGEVFVCDGRRHRLAIFDPDGLYLYQIPGGKVFRAPLDVAVDPGGTLLLLAHEEAEPALLRLDFDGRPLGRAELSGLPDDPAPQLVSIALSPSGERLYALDQAHLRLWIARREGDPAAADWTVTASVDLAEGLDDKDARELLLGRVDVYGDTVLVAVPTHGEVRLFDPEGRPRGRVGFKGTAPCQSAFPVAAALGADGNVLILDSQRMLFMTWDPRTNRCLAEHSGFGNAPGFFYKPADLALDAAGRVYVSQGFEGRVQVFAGASPAAGADSR